MLPGKAGGLMRAAVSNAVASLRSDEEGVTIMIRSQRSLFSVAAGFWLVAGALAAFGIVNLGSGSADAALVMKSETHLNGMCPAGRDA
jgi:hypothetical protein